MKRRGVITVLIVLAMLSGAFSASADPLPSPAPNSTPTATPPTPSPTTPSGSPSDQRDEDEGVLVSDDVALSLDAQQLAKQSSLSEAEALATLRNQPLMESFIEEVRAVAGDRLAGAWIEAQPNEVVLRITGEDSDSRIEQAAKDVNFPVVVRRRATATLMTKVSVAENVILKSWATSDGRVNGISVDDKVDGLTFDVSSEAVAIPPEVQSVLRDRGLTYKIKVSSPVTDSDRGGRNMSSCTSGFVYQAPTGLRIVLARHCLNQSFFWFDGNGPYTTTYVSDVYNSFADLQWRSSDDNSQR